MTEIPSGESIGSRSSEIWIEIAYQESRRHIEAHVTWLEAYGHGDEALDTLAVTLQGNANIWGKKVVHIARASNLAAEDLFSRTHGYIDDGMSGTNHMFHKEFDPET